ERLVVHSQGRRRFDSSRSVRGCLGRHSTCHGSRRLRSATRNEDPCALEGVVRSRSGRTDTSRSLFVFEPKEVHVRTHLTRLRGALVLLLVGSGLLFAVGSTIERHQHHGEQPATAASASRESGNSGESGGEN